VIVLDRLSKLCLDVGQAKPGCGFGQHDGFQPVAPRHQFVLRYARWLTTLINADHLSQQIILRLIR
jgi:hypothetical protein